MIKTWQHPDGWDISIEIRNGSPPVYHQLVEQVRYRIASNHLAPGRKLPTVRELADALGINFNTVSKAYHELSRQGLIVGRKGGGSLVATAPVMPKEDKQRRIQELYRRFIADAAVYGATESEIKKQFRKGHSS